MTGLWILITFSLVVITGWQLILRKKAELHLKEAREQLHFRESKINTILNNAPIVFSHIDAQGLFQLSEGKGLEKLGRKWNQSVGLSIYDMHNQNPIILDAVRKALSGEQVSTTFVLKGIHYDLFMGPHKNTVGEVIGASMLSVDITDRTKIEEEKAQLLVREQSAVETSKLKSEFLATMSHEIRTPINGVIGMTSLLLDTSLNSVQKEYAEAIQQSGSGLLTVINDILDFSKVESGALEFEIIDFDFLELLRNTTKTLSILAHQKGIVLSTDVDPSVQAWLKGDPGRIRQILNNLIGNAIKFTPKGEVHVRVFPNGSPIDVHGHVLRFEIEDTGIGMSKQSLERMFIAFSQAEASMSRRFGGTGLGLSISKQLVEKMGGQIGVTSKEGEGSIFWFMLSFDLGQAPGQVVSSIQRASAPQSSPKSGTPLILVVEDNCVNQLITVKMLEKMGFNTNVAADGFEAIEALNQNVYDLVLMDCQMPKMDGLEATQIFRAGNSKLNQGVPILALTANAMKGDREKCLAVGMNDYITKPVSYEALNQVIHKWFELLKKAS